MEDLFLIAGRSYPHSKQEDLRFFHHDWVCKLFKQIILNLVWIRLRIESCEQHDPLTI